MISIRIEGDGRDRLIRLAGDLAGGSALMAYRMAEAYEGEIRETIAAGRSFTSRTGRLEQSIGWRPDGDGAVVYASAPHAGYIEEGTRGPYPIRPRAGRKALRWFGGGGEVIRRSVIHPGIRARPYFYADQARRQASLLDMARRSLAAEIARG